jgi:hypothetical protein
MEVMIRPEIEIEPDLSYQEHPSKILDCKERSTRAKTTKCIRSNGATIRKKRLRGRPRIICANTTPIFYLRKLVRNHTHPLPTDSKYGKDALNEN